MLAADIGMHGLERCALVDQHGHLAGCGADRDLALAHDRFSDGLDGHRFRQRRREPVQPIGARGERAISRFARAQRDFGLLMPFEFLVRAGAHRLGFGAGALRRLVLPRPIERLRGSWSEHEQIIPIVAAEGAAARENSSWTTATTRLPMTSGTATTAW